MFVSLTEWGKLSTNFTIMHVHDILLVVASSGKMLIHKFRKQRMVCAGNKTIKQRDRCPIENKISWTMAHVHTENQYRYICTIRPKYYITQLYTINSWQRTLCLVMTPDLAAWRNPMYVANWLPLWEWEHTDLYWHVFTWAKLYAHIYVIITIGRKCFDC